MGRRERSELTPKWRWRWWRLRWRTGEWGQETVHGWRRRFWCDPALCLWYHTGAWPRMPRNPNLANLLSEDVLPWWGRGGGIVLGDVWKRRGFGRWYEINRKGKKRIFAWVPFANLLNNLKIYIRACWESGVSLPSLKKVLVTAWWPQAARELTPGVDFWPHRHNKKINVIFKNQNSETNIRMLLFYWNISMVNVIMEQIGCPVIVLYKIYPLLNWERDQNCQKN